MYQNYTAEFKIIHSDGDHHINSIVFYNGKLFINQKIVPYTIDDNYMFWQFLANDGTKSNGHFVMSRDMHALRGWVETTEDRASFSAICSNTYSVIYTQNQQSLNWYSFQYGFEKDDKGNPTNYEKLVKATGSTLAAPDDVFNAKNVVVTVGDRQKNKFSIQYEITLNKDVVDFHGDPFIKATLQISIDAQTLGGFLNQYDSHKTKDGDIGASVPVTGALVISDNMKACMKMLSESTIEAVEPYQISHDEKKKLKDSSLSVFDLYTLNPPSNSDVHELAFTKMKNIMLYAISDDNLKWFGVVRPTLGTITMTQADIDLLNDCDIKSVLTDKFCIGYLSQAFSGSSDDKIKKKFEGINDYTNKLNYFWKGANDITCLANGKAYAQLTTQLADHAMQDMFTGIQPYLADKANWAKQLYDYCLQDPVFSKLVSLSADNANSRLLQLVALLHVLDPTNTIDYNNKKISYASSLYQKVISAKLAMVATNSVIDTDNFNIEELLTEFLRLYFTKLANGEITSDADGALKKSLEDYMKEQKVNDINGLVANISTIVSNIAGIIEAYKSEGIMTKMKYICKSVPSLPDFLYVGLGLANYCLAYYQMVVTFQNWKKIGTAEKVLVITNTFDATFNLIKDVKGLANMIKVSIQQRTQVHDVIQAGIELNNVVEETPVTEFTDIVAAQINGDTESVSSSISQAGAETAAAVAAEGVDETAGIWAKISSLGGQLCGALTVVALGAAMVCNGIAISNDFKTGQYVAVKVIDILQIVCTGIAFTVELATLTIATLCDAIPVIGIVAMVVGIGLAIASIFIHRKPPPTPAEEFIDKTITPFINKLISPTVSWIQQQSIADARLNSIPAL